jgi:glutathione synthase
MTRKLLVVMDPIEAIHYKKDSTLAMLWEAQDRGYQLFYSLPEQLYSENGNAFADARMIQVFRDETKWFSYQAVQSIALTDMSVILMRQDPPFNMRYIFVTYLLDLAEKAGVLVVNKPEALRNANEKFFINDFPHYITPTLVSPNQDKIKAFLQQHEDIIVKPLDNMGGSSIFRVTLKDPNINVILEAMTQDGQRMTMVQRYISAIREGDKRILVVDGEPLPYVIARFAKEGETRANLAAGGCARGQAISASNLAMAKEVGKVLKQRGILFAGLDVIGDYLTEINITSPTCIREMEAAFPVSVSGLLFDAIEKRF